MTAARPGGSSAALPAQEALDLADALAKASLRALGDALAGVILHGSLTLGDYLPGCSDIDLLAVVNAPISDVQAAALARAVGQQRPRTRIRVDLRVVTRKAAGAPTPLPPMEAHLTTKRSDPRLRIDGHHPGERDLVVEFSICRAHGRSLLGAPPSELIGEVPDEWVLEVGDTQLANWQAIGDDPPYAQLTVLTACRVWRFAEERRHSSKDAAGQWALRRDPTLKVIRDALHQRRSDPTHPIDAAQVHDLLALVRDRLAPSRARTAGARGVEARPTGPCPSRHSSAQ